MDYGCEIRLMTLKIKDVLLDNMFYKVQVHTLIVSENV